MSVIQNHEAQVRFSDAKKEYITYSAIRKHISFRKNLKILKFPILKYFFIECVQIKLYLLFAEIFWKHSWWKTWWEKLVSCAVKVNKNNRLYGTKNCWKNYYVCFSFLGKYHSQFFISFTKRNTCYIVEWRLSFKHKQRN